MDKFQKFAELFRQYNSHTNLMSKNDAEKLETKHIPDSLAIKNFFEKYYLPEKILDIGTGGGFPAIPIALEYEKIKVFALDSTAKKIKFIENVKNELILQNLFPVCSRIEDFDKKEFFDVVTTRAVANLSSILEYSAPFAKINGYIVAYKSKTADDELLLSKNALKILGLNFIEKIDCKIGEELSRCLLVFQKMKQTPKNYPRGNNLVRKNPL